ncbi:hypothetical protein BDV09DRAFT_163854 [Aspergillus tetrazonus]
MASRRVSRPWSLVHVHQRTFHYRWILFTLCSSLFDPLCNLDSHVILIFNFLFVFPVFASTRAIHFQTRSIQIPQPGQSTRSPTTCN